MKSPLAMFLVVVVGLAFALAWKRKRDADAAPVTIYGIGAPEFGSPWRTPSASVPNPVSPDLRPDPHIVLQTW